ncbi:hypothetical protein R1flu_018899 [Riccia fluitans]|uniref:Uncharacterized protein n=1 Tax=Riccia fluitans TaxID=41844 RepID=A0ABD1ZIN9_9MARC
MLRAVRSQDHLNSNISLSTRSRQGLPVHRIPLPCTEHCLRRFPACQTQMKELGADVIDSRGDEIQHMRRAKWHQEGLSHRMKKEVREVCGIEKRKADSPYSI